MLLIIQPYQFALPTRHREGDILSDLDARSLNAYRLTCIRETTVRWVREAESQSEDGTLSPSQLAELDRRITELWETYTYSPREVPPSLFELEIQRVIDDRLASAPDGPEVRSALATDPAVIAEARARLAARAGAATLEDLLS